MESLTPSHLEPLHRRLRRLCKTDLTDYEISEHLGIPPAWVDQSCQAYRPRRRRYYRRRLNPYYRRRRWRQYKRNPYRRNRYRRWNPGPWSRELSAEAARSHMEREAGPPPYGPPEPPEPPKPKQRKKKAIKKKRKKPLISRYEQKRMAKFAKHNIDERDAEYAVVRFQDKVPYGSDHCTLCGARLSARYHLYFRKPPKEDRPHRIMAVDFFPVGNICMTNWAEALPLSEDRDVILEGIEAQMHKASKWEEPIEPEPVKPKPLSPEMQALFDKLGDETDDDW